MDLKWLFKRYSEHTKALYDNYESVVMIKLSIEKEDLSTAKETWGELGHDIQSALWLAPSKGGVFSTREREVIKSDDWNNG